MKNVRIKSIFIAVVLCVVGSTQCIAQNERNHNFYYADNKAIEWYDDSSSVNIIVADTTKYNDVAEVFATYFMDDGDSVLISNEDDNIIISSPKLLHTSIHSIIEQLSIPSEYLSFIRNCFEL